MLFRPIKFGISHQLRPINSMKLIITYGDKPIITIDYLSTTQYQTKGLLNILTYTKSLCHANYVLHQQGSWL